MLNVLDRILPWLFAFCIGFVLMSVGIFLASYHLAPSGLYQSALNKIAPSHERATKHKNTGPIKASDALTENNAVQKTFAGNTLITKEDDSIVLVDMDGKPVHTWHLPFKKVWAENIADRNRLNIPPFFAYAQLYPNGEVMAIYHTKATKKNPLYGAGLVRMDKKSNVIWEYGANVHDAFYTAADGRIYTLVQTPNRDPVQGLHYTVNPPILDYIVIISPDGHQEKQIPLLNAFFDTPYEEYLYASGNNIRNIGANSIVILEKDIADKFPLFKAGDILVSLGGINTLAVIDPESGKVRWAGRGVFRRQYDASFISDGTIMVYDTSGYYDSTKINRERILQIDPANQAVRWVYIDEEKNSITTKMSGTAQKLPNGNVMFTEDDAGQLTEVTPDGEKVWQYTYPIRITSAQRVSYDYLDKSLWLGQ